MRISTGR